MNSLWPEVLAADWDRVGLLAGHPSAPVQRVLCVVDVTPQTVAEAIGLGCDTILAHHPFLLRGVTSVAEDTVKGALVSSLARANLAVIAAHTNADATAFGVATTLANLLNLHQTYPIDAQATGPIDGAQSDGIGRVGTLEADITLEELAQQLADILPVTISGVRVSGLPSQRVRTVALCPGAGDSLLDHPEVRKADVYITSDLRHHPARDIADLRDANLAAPALIDVSHWACESLWLEVAASQLARALPSVEFVVSAQSTDPWDFSVAAQQSRFLRSES